MINRHGLLTAVSVAVLLVAGSVLAESGRPPCPSVPYTPYILLSIGRQEVGGGFRGEQIVSSVKGFFAVPSVGDGTSLGISVGLRNVLLGVEGSYRQADHEVAMGDVSADGSSRALEIEGRLFAPMLGPVRPFVGGSMSVEWLSAENAYCSDSTDMHCTARFEGLGFSVGTGAMVHLHERFFLSGRLAYRWTDYDTVESVEAGEGTLPLAVKAEGWTWVSGIGIEF